MFPAIRFLLPLPILLALLVPAAVCAQVRVSGSVSERDSHAPIPGATVWNVSQRQGTVAGPQGRFSVSVRATDTLEFRAVGFETHRMFLAGTGLSQLVVQVQLKRGTVLLGEVTVQEGRPNQALINRALRNIKRPVPPLVSQVKRPPKPIPLFAVDSTGPKQAQPTLENPMSLLYEQFSRAGMQRRKLAEIYEQQRVEAERQKQRRYNDNFLDDRGHEVERPGPQPPAPAAAGLATPLVPRQPPAGSLVPRSE